MPVLWRSACRCVRVRGVRTRPAHRYAGRGHAWLPGAEGFAGGSRARAAFGPSPLPPAAAGPEESSTIFDLEVKRREQQRGTQAAALPSSTSTAPSRDNTSQIIASFGFVLRADGDRKKGVGIDRVRVLRERDGARQIRSLEQVIVEIDRRPDARRARA